MALKKRHQCSNWIECISNSSYKQIQFSYNLKESLDIHVINFLAFKIGGLVSVYCNWWSHLVMEDSWLPPYKPSLLRLYTFSILIIFRKIRISKYRKEKTTHFAMFQESSVIFLAVCSSFTFLFKAAQSLDLAAMTALFVWLNIKIDYSIPVYHNCLHQWPGKNHHFVSSSDCNVLYICSFFE